MRNRFCLALLLVLAMPAAASEQASPVTEDVDGPWTLNLYFENDLFGETDQNYTNGLRASWVSPDLSSYLDDPQLPGWLTEVNHRLRFLHDLREGLSQNLVASVGQLIYTPRDINATGVVADDRPYAGYLYAGIAFHTRSRRRLDSIELYLGVIGPASYAHEAQDLIHELRGFEKFRGWDNQLENEPGLQLLYEQKRRLFAGPLLPDTGLLPPLEQDVIAHAGISLGNVASHVNAGGEYRIGWRLPDDFGTSAVRPGGDNSAPGRTDPRALAGGLTGVHLFLAFDVRAVGRDIFLDGNSFRGSHRVDKKHLVADASTGISLLLGRWKLSYAQVFRSREFDGQPHGHEYGSLSLSYSW